MTLGARRGAPGACDSAGGGSSTATALAAIAFSSGFAPPRARACLRASATALASAAARSRSARSASIFSASARSCSSRSASSSSLP